MSVVSNQQLLSAATRGNLETVKEWKRQNPNANINTIVGMDGYTPLHVACYGGHLDVVKYVVETCNGDATTPSNGNIGALHRACVNGHMDVVLYLVESCDIDVHAQSKRGNTALHSACRHGHLDIVRYLAESSNIHLSIANNDGDTPLHRACRFGSLEVVKYLVNSRNANITLLNSDKQTPLDLAKAHNYTHVISFWASHCMDLLSEQMEDTQQQTADEASDEAPATTSDNRRGLSTKINIGQDRLNAIHTGALADIIFLCGEGDKQEAVKANSAVLFVTVPSIKALIDSGIKNQTPAQSTPTSPPACENSVDAAIGTTILLPNSYPKHVQYVLKCIYSGDVSFEDGSEMTAKDDLKQLVLVANQFGFWRLKLIIEAELVHKHLANATMIDLLLFAYQNNCLVLKEAAIAMVSKDGNALFDHPGVGDLCGHVKLMKEICAKRQGNLPDDGVTDEYSSMSMMEMYKALSEEECLQFESYMDRASLLKLLRSRGSSKAD